ncbi:hypothetical protein, partial [Burkholderia cepacia]|uniref:hypothetical protein n=1 Tax=Burkholderia cepacia TaxID=292 RepID=UPI001CF559B4
MGNMVINPIAFLTNLQGEPLQDGKVYIGEPNTNPVTNPVTVYQDAALTIPMTQPLATTNGFVSLNGSPQSIYVAGAAYSLLVTDNCGRTVISLPNYTNPLMNEVGGGGAALIGFDGTTLDQQFASRVNRVVDSIIALRAVKSSLYTRAIVTGYYAPHDGGGGPYQFDPIDTTSADNGVTIIVASDGGRWKLQWSYQLSIEQAGAKGDGTTDNTNFINNLIAIMQANGGGKITVPARASGFRVAGTLSITAGGVSIVGANRQGSLITFDNGAADCITFSGSSFSTQIYGFELRDMRIQFGTKTGGRTFYAANSNQIVLQNLEINGCWTGIELFQNNTVKIADVVMQGVTSSTGYGIYWHAAADGSGRSDWLILDNWAVNCMYSGANGFVCDGLVATLIATRCNILQCTVNILVYNSAESGNNFPNYLQFTDV